MPNPIEKHRYRGVDYKQALRVSRHQFYEALEYDGSLLVATERLAMGAALAFRKLLTHQVLSNEVRDGQHLCLSYPRTSPPEPRLWFDGTVDLVNYHHFVRHYDLHSPRDAEMTLKSLSDLLLHSLVFVVWPRPDEAVEDTRFFFNSDHRHHVVWEMTVGRLFAVVDEVLEDEVVWVDHRKDQKNPDRQEQHNRTWVAARRADRAA